MKKLWPKHVRDWVMKTLCIYYKIMTGRVSWRSQFTRPRSRTRRPRRSRRSRRGQDVFQASHQEAAERVHALHEGDAAKDRGRVHTQRERSHQSNPWQKGEKRKEIFILKVIKKTRGSLTMFELITELMCVLF